MATLYAFRPQQPAPCLVEVWAALSNITGASSRAVLIAQAMDAGSREYSQQDLSKALAEVQRQAAKLGRLQGVE